MAHSEQEKKTIRAGPGSPGPVTLFDRIETETMK